MKKKEHNGIYELYFEDEDYVRAVRKIKKKAERIEIQNSTKEKYSVQSAQKNS